MEYLIFLAAMVLFVAAVFLREAVGARQRERKFIESLYRNFGKLPDRKYTIENSAHIPGYFQRHRGKGQLDDITWNDLDMDAVFRRMNYTHSATGEEYLYWLLRSTGCGKEEHAYFETAAGWFSEHDKERVQLQLCMSRLGYTGKYSLYDYIENLDTLGKRSNVRHLVADLLFLPLAALLPFYLTYALLGIAVLSVYQIMTYFKDKGEIEPYITSFAYITRLIHTGEEICRLDIPVCRGKMDEMRDCLSQTKGIRRGSFWVFTASSSRTSGNPLELILDYLRMIFHLDLIIFNKMLRQLRDHLEAVDRLITLTGALEAATVISCFRASLKDGWCVPVFSEKTGIRIEAGYHPLLEHPVKNSIDAQRGVLLTGSNASGKSTFLKMVAVNGILAQTVHTCAADAYSAPGFAIFSSMALRDDLSSGESYYVVEIKALKRILDAVKEEAAPVLCFVDEVLRGTNTVERIAASAQILKSLRGRNVLCFAATHDIELTELLKEWYDNYHFEEEIRDGDISFEYRLLEGKATTQNAIRLLELIGYDEEITRNALESAGRFLESGTWQA